MPLPSICRGPTRTPSAPAGKAGKLLRPARKAHRVVASPHGTRLQAPGGGGGWGEGGESLLVDLVLRWGMAGQGRDEIEDAGRQAMANHLGPSTVVGLPSAVGGLEGRGGDETGIEGAVRPVLDQPRD